eukprot:63925-Rhodomonas_salina.1
MSANLSSTTESTHEKHMKRQTSQYWQPNARKLNKKQTESKQMAERRSKRARSNLLAVHCLKHVSLTTSFCNSCVIFEDVHPGIAAGSSWKACPISDCPSNQKLDMLTATDGPLTEKEDDGKEDEKETQSCAGHFVHNCNLLKRNQAACEDDIFWSNGPFRAVLRGAVASGTNSPREAVGE